MRRIMVSNLISLDGYIEDREKELDWHQVDEEFLEYARALVSEVGGMLFGRKTYLHMAAYWQTAPSDPIADWMNRLPKVVFSKTLREASWENTRIEAGDAGQAVRQLKSEEGKDLVILGSADLVTALLAEGLIDEYRIILNPIVLGGGKPHIGALPKRVPMTLVDTQILQSGNVILSYRPKS